MRIASLISSGTEILFALDLGQRVVAVSHECDHPPAVQRLPRATRSAIDSSLASGQIDSQVKSRLAGGMPLYEIDAQLLCRLSPDLIVTQAQCDVCAVRYADVVDLVAAQPELAAARILPLNPQSLADVLEDVRRVGQAADASACADRLASALRHRIEAVRERVGCLPSADRPRVVCIEWVSPLMTAGNWTPELIELAGGCSLLATTGQHSDYVPWATIRNIDPDVLLIAPCGFGLARSQSEALLMRLLPGFARLAAVRRGRVFVFDGNAYLNRSGPRLIESLELLACLIHPELFGPPTGELAEGRAWSRLPALQA